MNSCIDWCIFDVIVIIWVIFNNSENYTVRSLISKLSFYLCYLGIVACMYFLKVALFHGGNDNNFLSATLESPFNMSIVVRLANSQADSWLLILIIQSMSQSNTCQRNWVSCVNQKWPIAPKMSFACPNCKLSPHFIEPRFIYVTLYSTGHSETLAHAEFENKFSLKSIEPFNNDNNN